MPSGQEHERGEEAGKGFPRLIGVDVMGSASTLGVPNTAGEEDRPDPEQCGVIGETRSNQCFGFDLGGTDDQRMRSRISQGGEKALDETLLGIFHLCHRGK